MAKNNDVTVLRELARRYAAAAADPVQDQKRQLWDAHNSLQPTRVPVLATFGMWNVWCREVFADAQLQCQDEFYRAYERHLKMGLFHYAEGDDWIQEPWITVPAVRDRGWNTLWGVNEEVEPSGVEGGAWKYRPALTRWEDMSKLSWPRHVIDEAATQRNAAKLSDALGEILPIHIARGPLCHGFLGDISSCLAKLRGLEQLMLDMCEEPARLQELLAFMRDGVLANLRAAQVAGDLAFIDGQNQEMIYGGGLPRPRPNTYGAQLPQLWGFFAAQELTLVSPAMHEEFMLNYQLPIMRQYGLTAYGCCEDLTTKITMLRKVPNLRIIGVAPRADLAKCAQQIGRDYVISWRPNPTNMISAGFDESLIRKIIRAGLAQARGCILHIHLKDIETVEGDPTRMQRWVQIVKDETTKSR